MSEFQEEEYCTSHKIPMQYYEIDCPYCRQKIRRMDESKRQGYWEDKCRMLSERVKYLQKENDRMRQNREPMKGGG